MSPAIASFLSYGAVFALGILVLCLMCWAIAWLFDRFVLPLFLTHEELFEREQRRQAERIARLASKDYKRRQRLRTVRFFNF